MAKNLSNFYPLSDLCSNKGHQNVVRWFPGCPNLRQTYVWCSRWGICGLFFLSILSDLPLIIETDTQKKLEFTTVHKSHCNRAFGKLLVNSNSFAKFSAFLCSFSGESKAVDGLGTI